MCRPDRTVYYKPTGGQTAELKCMTLIDPATGWFEIVEIPDKKSQTLATLLVRVWLSRYPLPQKLIVDNGTEFKREFYE